jgi:hypothetical protein
MVNSHKINVVLITFHTTMSTPLTKQQEVIVEILKGFQMISNPKWDEVVNILNPTTGGGIFEEIPLTAESLKRLKVILAAVGVSFLPGGVMEFPPNFKTLLPEIAERFVKEVSGSAEHAPPHASGGGGGAAARDPPGKKDGSKGPCPKGESCYWFHQPTGCRFGHKHENAGNQHSAHEEERSGSKPATRRVLCGGEAAHHASGGGGGAPILHKRAPPGKKDGYKPACPQGESCMWFHCPQGCKFGHQETGNQEKVVVHLRPQPSKPNGSGREISSSCCQKVISSGKPENVKCRYELNCKRWGTFGECDYVHKEGARRELPPKNGPHSLMCEVCVHGNKCKSLKAGGTVCNAIHPQNLCAQVIKMSSRGAAIVSVALVCSVHSQTQSCPTKHCPYAHLSEEDLKKVPERKERKLKKVKAIIADTSNIGLSPDDIAAADKLARGDSNPSMLYAIGTLPAHMKPENQEKVKAIWGDLGYNVHLPVRGNDGEDPLNIDLKIAAEIIACCLKGEMKEEIVVCTNDAGDNKGEMSIRAAIQTVLRLGGNVRVMCYEHGKRPYEKLRDTYPTSLTVHVTSHAEIKEKTEQMKVSSVPAMSFAEPTFV